MSHWSPLQPCQLFLSTKLPSQATAVAAASGDRDWFDMCEGAPASWLFELTSHSVPHTACCWSVLAVLMLPCDDGCTLGNVSLTWRVTQEPAFVSAVDFISRKQTIPLQDSCKQCGFAIKRPHNCCFPVLEPRQQRQWDLLAPCREKKADPLLCLCTWITSPPSWGKICSGPGGCPASLSTLCVPSLLSWELHFRQHNHSTCHKHYMI